MLSSKQRLNHAEALPHPPSRGTAIWKRLSRHKSAAIGAAAVFAVFALALLGPLIVPHSPSRITVDMLSPPSAEHWLGTDAYGRDALSRIAYGTRESMALSTLALLVGFFPGCALAVLGAYHRGWMDTVVAKLVDLLMSFPSIMIALLILAMLGEGGRTPIALAIGITLIPRFERVLRGSALTVCAQDYLLAAKALGVSDTRIMLRHMIPNLVGPIIVLVTVYFPFVILLEASLSYLGIGAPPDVPTLGRIIADGRPYLRVAPWLSISPGLVIMVAVLGFNLLGDGLRDTLDPHTARDR